MAKAAAKKSVPKKGKYFLIFSSATQALDEQGPAPWSQQLRQPLHGLGIIG